jgi:hypothetical protein
VLTVVTLAKDTDFYNQTGIYHELSDAKEFINHFLEHLQDESTGYYFPVELKKQLFPTFMRDLLDQIHKSIFEGKKQLGLHQRLDFIELTYLLIELKLLEIVQPTLVSHLSKDSLDISATTSVELLVLLSTLQGQKIEREHLDYLLFGPTLMLRERPIHVERFERMISLLRLLEKSDLKSIRPLFSKTPFHLVHAE